MSRSDHPTVPPVLQARRLCKYYGSVVAAEAIDLDILGGELLALVGDNGAGKSTLVHMLSGALRPDAGEIFHRGERIVFESPNDARERGINIAYQNLALSPSLDVAANLYLGREVVHRIPFLPHSLGLLNRRAMQRGTLERLRDLQIDVPVAPEITVGQLSGGQRQAVAIARAAAWTPDVLFLDEPTAALGVKQSKAVLMLARRLVGQGHAVVLISHALPLVMEYTDRIVVLRRGRKVADLRTQETTQEQLVALIVGFAEGQVPADLP